MITLRRFTFGDGAGPHLLITGGVHGDEFEPMAAIRELIDLFRQQDQRVASLHGRVTLVPVVNKAAFLRGHRCADDGLDLARTCPGNPSGSVTQRTAFALSELIRSADFYIDLHTGGTEFAVLPLAGYTLHADAEVRATQQRMALAFQLPLVWGTAANLDGRSLSVARDAGVPAIYCEYLGAATCVRAGVDAYVEGCLNVMRELRLLNAPVVTGCEQVVIENPTPGSGHMQVCHPSPVDGLFEPAVELGTKVCSGQILGSVLPLDGGDRVSIPADSDGMVIVLRTFPRVRSGESIGVVAS